MTRLVYTLLDANSHKTLQGVIYVPEYNFHSFLKYHQFLMRVVLNPFYGSIAQHRRVHIRYLTIRGGGCRRRGAGVGWGSELQSYSIN